MAGLKKSSKKDVGGPNMVLLIALIMFILTSIGLGAFAYYGYDGQDKLRQALKAAKLSEESMKELRDNYQLLSIELMLGEGYEIRPEDKANFAALKNDMISNPDKFKDVKVLMDVITAEHIAKLKGYNAQEVKYESNYKAQITAALDDAKKSKVLVDSVQKEYNDFKANYEALVLRHVKDIKSLQDLIKKGNEDAFNEAVKLNQQFPKLQELNEKIQADRKAEAARHDEEKLELEGRIARTNAQIADLEKKLNDRSIGNVGTPQAGGGDLHALMLDISRGQPLWDRPLGKIVRVDPTNLLVYIDIGAKAGLRPDVSFNVFGTGPGGKADRQMKGTIEVVRVINESTSSCRVTSLYEADGKSVPLQSEGSRLKAIRAMDSILTEGDLLFNTFFDTHVFIVGNVNFTGYLSDSPSTQSMQLRDFIEQLRKQNIVVDGYINLMNGQVEGDITPRTRLLIRGDFAPLNRTEQEQARSKAIVTAYQEFKRKAIDQGMFVI
ncbi:MAG: hypothetical protein WCL32_14010, partial [Planctomycetota bacterium]